MLNLPLRCENKALISVKCIKVNAKRCAYVLSLVPVVLKHLRDRFDTNHQSAESVDSLKQNMYGS